LRFVLGTHPIQIRGIAIYLVWMAM
jgi:hypothetical protein